MIRPTILWALAMLGGGLFGLAFSLRPPAGRAYPGALRKLLGWREVRHAAAPASRLGVGSAGAERPARRSPLTSGEWAGQGLAHRVPSPVFVLAAARYGAGPSYAAALSALRRVNQSVTQSEGGRLIQQPARRPGGLSHL